jgi:putative two-component system response regulator
MDGRRKKIMLVDDNVTNLLFAKSTLSDAYDVYTAPSTARMFSILESTQADLILLDMDLPDMDGIEAIRILKQTPMTKAIPVIFLTSAAMPEREVSGLGLGAADYILKPFDPKLLRKRVEVHLIMEDQKEALAEQGRELERLRAELARRGRGGAGGEALRQEAILSSLFDLIEGRGFRQLSHIDRTRLWIEMLAESLMGAGLYRSAMEGWDPDFFCSAARLHDIGKISIPDHIILKSSRVTEEEFAVLKTHAAIGAGMIDQIALGCGGGPFWGLARTLALTHHEKWDGSGYPCGLKGEDIPLEGRIMALADVYDALTSVRPYKMAYPHGYAVEIIASERGRHFDPILVDAFLQNRHRFEEGQKAGRLEGQKAV